MAGMDKLLRVFNGFEDAEHADEEYYASLTPQQRVDMLLDIVARYGTAHGDTPAGFERVCRVTQLSQS